MEFDKSRVYTALNADELEIGSRCFFADTIQDLRQKVQDEDGEICVGILTNLYGDDNVERFVAGCFTYIYAYLIELPSEPKYKPFENVEEAMKAIKEHGGWVKNSLGTCWLITGYATKEKVTQCLHIANNWESSDSLLRNYVFADDGSPCGIKINNLPEEK